MIAFFNLTGLGGVAQRTGPASPKSDTGYEIFQANSHIYQPPQTSIITEGLGSRFASHCSNAIADMGRAQ